MKLSRLLLTALLVISILAVTACGSKDKEAEITTDTESTDTGGAGGATDESATDSATTTEDTSETPAMPEPLVIDYGAGLNDNGHLEGITALDYVELLDYENITIPSDVHTISDEVLDAEITNLLSYFTTTEEVTDRALVDGDTVNIDYVGSIDGVEFEGGNTMGNGAEVQIGVTAYIDDFLAQLIGHTPGESFDIEVTFPEDYGKEDLNGKDAVFAITVNHIIEQVNPELNDQFVLDNLAADYQWTTVDEMKDGMKEDMQTAAIRNFIQGYILENSTITELPDEAYTYQENVMVNYYKNSANQYGMEVDAFLAASVGVANLEELMALSTEQVIEAANFTMVLQAIAEDAEIVIGEEEMTKYFLVNAGMNDYSAVIEQYGVAYIKSSILQENILVFITDNAELE